MYDMFTVMHVKIENGIHWVTSIINQFENKTNGLGIKLPILDSEKENNNIKELLSPRHRVRYI